MSAVATKVSGATRRAHNQDRRVVQDRRRGLRAGLSELELRRAQILAAMSTMLDADGVERTSVTRLVHRARVPRAAFYQHFKSRDDALLALVESALERSRTTVLEAGVQERSWLARTRAGLQELLALYEAEPGIGRLCLTHSRHPVPEIQRLREEALEQVTAHIAEGTPHTHPSVGALSDEGTVAGVVGILEARLTEQAAPALSGLAGELMSFIVLPSRGRYAAQRERTRPRQEPRPKTQPVKEPEPGGLRITYRTMRVLVALAESPGLSNSEVAARSGIVDQGQISKLLKRLQALGLIANDGAGISHGAANAWRLTDEGEKTKRLILDHHVPPRS